MCHADSSCPPPRRVRSSIAPTWKRNNEGCVRSSVQLNVPSAQCSTAVLSVSALQEEGFHVVHFSAHGSALAIYLGASGGPPALQMVPYDDLAPVLIENRRDTMCAVVFNCCAHEGLGPMGQLARRPWSRSRGQLNQANYHRLHLHISFHLRRKHANVDATYRFFNVAGCFHEL